MPLKFTRRVARSLQQLLRPGRFQNEMATAPLVDFETLVPAEHRIVVVAPHPDDEVIGCGGMLAAAAEHNNPVALIAVTDGEACYPPSPNWTRQQLAATRRAETMEALHRLGIMPTAVDRLGLPDGEVRQHKRVLIQQLCRLIRPGDVVITTWRHDGHPDHDMVGGAAAEAADMRGAKLIEVPIWAWHRPAEQWQLRGLEPKRMALTSQWETRKEYAMAAYASQIRPTAPLPSDPALPPEMVSGWLRSWEAVFV